MAVNIVIDTLAEWDDGIWTNVEVDSEGRLVLTAGATQGTWQSPDGVTAGQDGTVHTPYYRGDNCVWSQLTVSGVYVPTGGKVEVRTRSADTAAGIPTATWSAYEEITGTSWSHADPSSLGAYIQIEIRLTPPP